MAVPTSLKLTPQAAVTIGEGETTTAGSEFFQMVNTSTFIVYEGVPYALAQQIMQSNDPDTQIRTRLAGYPKRVQAV